ncbi:MAG TPA: GNAT family N-acetyltransferase [Flavipsychrobacter sp.]|nr:GNAT family N-acetyltransferase [Flavipsychrobacter sp.]
MGDQRPQLDILSVQIKDYYFMISEMMRKLQESEQEMFDKTAQWNDIEKNYLLHMMEMQTENDGTCLIAFIENKPCGFIFGYTEEPDESRIEEYTGKELYVSDGYVDPLYRRMGIYQNLNSKLEEIYINKGVRRIVRFTLVGNTRMQNFLEKHGYQTVRLLYEKWLSPDGKQPLPLKLTVPK